MFEYLFLFNLPAALLLFWAMRRTPETREWAPQTGIAALFFGGAWMFLMFGLNFGGTYSEADLFGIQILYWLATAVTVLVALWLFWRKR